MICARCLKLVHPGQLYTQQPCSCGSTVPAHVACPTSRQIAHALKVGRQP